MITYEEFVNDVLTLIGECPRYWRMGQSVFNIVDARYNVARTVQFGYGIDCFYDDNQIEEFLRKSYDVLKELQNEH